MSIPQHILLRYRVDGHLRFDLPVALRRSDLAGELVEGLRSMEGIYRVDLARGPGKLSIRYLANVCDFGAVVRRLHELVNRLAGPTAGAARPTGAAPRRAGPDPVPAVPADLRRWLEAKRVEIRETAEAIGILGRGAFRAVGQRPRWLSEFLNDLLMLYLIKMHWHHILTLWLPNPWRYRYEWAATFYLIHLSVQARLPKPA